MDLIQLAYASRPFGFDAPGLHVILRAARSNNARDDVTGALICRADLYLQLLEGPRDKVLATFARIASDDRHVDVRVLLRVAATGRLFAGWAMLDDPARSWIWTKQQVDGGELDRASPEEILAAFARVAADVGTEAKRPSLS